MNQVAKIDDVVDLAVRFDQEMDTTVQPRFRIYDSREDLAVEEGRWEEVTVGNRVVHEFHCSVRLPELQRQTALATVIEVFEAKGLGPPERDALVSETTLDDDVTPLLVFADLVRPLPAVSSWLGPNVECGSLEIDFAIEDEPSYYEPGAPIEPPVEKFGWMDLHVEKNELGVWAPLFAASLSDPGMHFVRPPPWASGSYRWWVEVEDSAGNLDQISFEQEGMERTSAEHFSVTSCEEESTFCRRLICNAGERSCDSDYTHCTSGDPCVSCHCDEIKETCECVNDCPPDPDPSDRPDESYILADDLPRWEDVENEDPAARVGVLMASNYPSMFGLLDEFGEKARLVIPPLSPQSLEGVELLIVPSGGLRNQQTEEFRGRAGSGYVDGQVRRRSRECAWKLFAQCDGLLADPRGARYSGHGSGELPARRYNSFVFVVCERFRRGP